MPAWWPRYGPPGYLPFKRGGGRLVGANELPAKVWIDSYERLWSVLGVEREVARFAELVADARSSAPRLVAWMVKHPLRVLELDPDWPAIVDAVLWIDKHADGDLYLRQVDVQGVDTKFIERHRSVLAELLDHQLDERRIDHAQPKSAFTARYGFRRRPAYVRLRPFGSGQQLAGGFNEISVRLDELAHSPPSYSSVYVIENEITYLAFPPVEDAVALLGGGYAVTALEQLGWLADRELIYWSDIDTHGFAMLDRLRHHFPHAASMLMDRATLLAHEGQWVQEGKRNVGHLECLHPSEAELYRGLVEDVLGVLGQARTGTRLVLGYSASPHGQGLHKGPVRQRSASQLNATIPRLSISDAWAQPSTDRARPPAPAGRTQPRTSASAA